MMTMPALRAQRALLDATQRALTTDPRRAAEDLRAQGAAAILSSLSEK